jgi:hypothetical protein
VTTPFASRPPHARTFFCCIFLRRSLQQYVHVATSATSNATATAPMTAITHTGSGSVAPEALASANSG